MYITLLYKIGLNLDVKEEGGKDFINRVNDID